MAAAPVTVSQTCILPLTLAPAYERTIGVALPEIFDKRHLALPATAEVTDQHGAWGADGPGQTRAIHLADGGILGETLTVVDPPHRFGYRIEIRRGPMGLLVDHVEGTWAFAPVTPDATRVTWSWDWHPRSSLTRPAVRVLASMWPAYAAHGLARLEAVVAG
jgi:hypothetical protein